MSSASTLSVLAGALALLASGSAFADINDIRAADKSVELEVGGSTFKYGETIADTTFDTETGTMISLDGGANWLVSSNSPALNDLYLHADLQGTFGSTHYNGALEDVFGDTIPYQSTTNDTIFHFSSKVGKFFPVGNNMAVIPYAGLGYRSWYRQLTGTGAYSETYEFGEAKGGVMVQASPIPLLVLSLSGDVGTTLGPNMRTQGVTFNLGSVPVWQVGGRVGYAFTPHFEAIGDVKFEGYGFGQSPIVDGAYEPDSYTHQLTFMAGLAYHLQ